MGLIKNVRLQALNKKQPAVPIPKKKEEINKNPNQVYEK